MIKIIIIEDHTMLKDLIKDSLNQEANLEVIKTDSDAQNALALCDKLKPDMILMDVCTANDSDGIYYSGKIKEKYPNIKIIIMTGMPEISFIEKARKNHVDSFIYKDISKESLISVIKNTYEGYSMYPDSTNKNTQSEILKNLTEKEMEILTLHCRGLDKIDIEEKLNISTRTLKNHITSILSKTGYPNISKLAIYCISQGLINPALKHN